MSTEKCKATVFGDFNNNYPCNRKAGVSGFCGIHSPEAVAKRKAKQDQAYTEKKVKWDAEWKTKHYNHLAGEACRKAGITLEQLEFGAGVVIDYKGSLDEPK